MKILITGMGVISAIGNNVTENLMSLKNSKDGISNITGLKNMRKSFVGGEIKLSNKELIEINDKIRYSDVEIIGDELREAMEAMEAII